MELCFHLVVHGIMRTFVSLFYHCRCDPARIDRGYPELSPPRPRRFANRPYGDVGLCGTPDGAARASCLLCPWLGTSPSSTFFAFRLGKVRIMGRKESPESLLEAFIPDSSPGRAFLPTACTSWKLCRQNGQRESPRSGLKPASVESTISVSQSSF